MTGWLEGRSLIGRCESQRRNAGASRCRGAFKTTKRRVSHQNVFAEQVMDESIYNEEMDGIYRMIRSGEYTSAIDKMMVGDGFRLDAVYKFDANHSWYVLGGIFLKIGNYNSAIESFRRSLKSWPEDVDALMAMGNIYSEIKKYKMAERFFRRGLLINPENLGMKFNLANALFDQGKLDLALKEYASIARQESDLSGQANRMIGLINQKARKTTRTRP